MNKKLKFFAFTLVIFFTYQNIVLADDLGVIPPPVINKTNIHLKIISGDSSLYDSNLDIDACDSDDNVDTPDTVSAYCAVLQSKLTSKWNWTWKPGAFVDSINDIAGYTSKDKDGKDVYHYWSWSSNGTSGMTGLNEYVPANGDIIILEFIDPKSDVVPPPVINKTNIHLKIISGDSSLYDSNLDIDACDSDDNVDTPDTVSAYCAVLQSKLTSKWNWTWKPGAFVDSINDIAGYTSKDKDGKDVYHYWSWSSNGTSGMTGLNEYVPANGDIIILEFIDPKSDVVPPPVINNNTGGSSFVSGEKVFSILNALNFLSKNQNSDGSFYSPVYTDWVAIAAVAGNSGNLKSSILNYLKSNEMISTTVTDNERRAMALMALGVNPYDGTGIDYIDKILSSFDGVQFGDPSFTNDDIFALIVLKNAGYNSTDDIIKKDVSYILSKQSGGSWGGIDITAAAIQAIRGLEELGDVSSSIQKGENYLISNIDSENSYSNNFSTSWVLQTLFNNSKIVKGESYLAAKQQIDGGLEDMGVDINTRVWSTSYAIPAILHKSWDDILNNFSKPIKKEDNLISSKEEELEPLKKEEIKKETIIIPKIEIQQKEVSVKNIKSKLIKKQQTLKPKQIENTNLLYKDNIKNIPDKPKQEPESSTFNLFWSIFKTPFKWFLVRLGF